MTEAVEWGTRARALKDELASIEQGAERALIPPDAMEGMRRAVDHCRMALWAAAVTASDAANAGEAAILAARLVRVQEMCERIVEAIAAGRVWAGTPGLGRFLASLEATERSVKPLLEESASAQGTSSG